MPRLTLVERDGKGNINQIASDEKNEINHERNVGNSILNNSSAALESKFESTKRKLQESYQNIEKGICFPFYSKEKT